MANFTLTGYDALVDNAVYASFAGSEQEDRTSVVVISRYTTPLVAEVLELIRERSERVHHVLLPVGRRTGKVKVDTLEGLLLNEFRPVLEPLAEREEAYFKILEKEIPRSLAVPGRVPLRHLLFRYGIITLPPEPKLPTTPDWYEERIDEEWQMSVMLDQGKLIPLPNIDRLQRTAPREYQPFKFSRPGVDFRKVEEVIAALYISNPSAEEILSLADCSEMILYNAAIQTLAAGRNALLEENVRHRMRGGFLLDPPSIAHNPVLLN